MNDLYGRPDMPWDEVPPDDHEPDPYDFTEDELEQAERWLERMRGGNLSYDNFKEIAK